MWNLIIKVLVDLAISWGLPQLLAFAAEKFPWLPKHVLDAVVAIATVILEKIKPVVNDPTISPAEKAKRVREIKRECIGVACAADTKGLG